MPGTDRRSILQYSFAAKVGIEGGDVEIEQTDEHSYTIDIPEFILIGYDDPTFEVAVESNGALSWVTPEIDEVEMVNAILDDEAQQQYVDANTEQLRQQAEVFYTGIVTGIDPEASIRFRFAGGVVP